jgi:SAM-dependent methyltransferase
MDIQTFLDLFIKELEVNGDLRSYYRLLENKRRFLWRKAYLEQRLNYINRQLKVPSGKIWDAGCGYATTSIFLALNGHTVYGNTLEYYFEGMGKRLDFWSLYGDMSKLKIEYGNLFDLPIQDESFNAIIAQDTLHHLEPVEDAIELFRRVLIPGGLLLVSEENGHCPYIQLKNFLQRGFSLVKEYHDERLNKTILIGNEHARSLQAWKQINVSAGLEPDDGATEFIRLLPPFCFTQSNYKKLLQIENKRGNNSGMLNQLFAFGINFTVRKPVIF